MSKKAKAIKAAYERTFGTEDGKAVLMDLIESTGLLAPSLDLNNPSSNIMAFNDGAKSIVHRIIHQVQLKPEQYLELLERKSSQEADFELD